MPRPATDKPARRILVVEDEPALQESIRRHLARKGFDVLVCSNSERALALIEENRPDLVCLDLNLPRESGYEVCETIRNRLKLRDLPIVLMSDRTSPEDRAHAEEAGANAYVVKPFTMGELTDRLKELLPEGRAR